MVSLLVFEKKDWILFFKTILFVSLIVLIKAFIQFFLGESRPSSFIGNPIFLSGYLLSFIFFSLVVFSEEKHKFWRYFSLSIIFLSLIGIFLAGTRGTILGLGAGLVAILIYGVIKGKDIFYKKLNLHKISIVLLSLIFIFSFIFISTRKNEIWQRVPGISRLAATDIKTETSKSRLIAWGIGIDSIKPKSGNLKNFIIGYGTGNFNIAFSQNFKPILYKFDNAYFDKAHNKFIDVLVENSFLGLISYIFIWFFLLKLSIKDNKFSLINLGIIFWSVSFMVYLLFAFDQIPVSVSFFVILSFVISNYYSGKEDLNINLTKVKQSFFGIFIVILTIFIVSTFIRGNLISYIQMRKYTSLLQKSDLITLRNNINSVLTPFSPAQKYIRKNFLEITTDSFDEIVNDKVKKDIISDLMSTAILKSEEYIQKQPKDFRFFGHLGDAYTQKGEIFNDIDSFIKAEYYFKQALILSPNRQDLNNNLALNLAYQKKYQESISLIKQNIELDLEAAEPYYYYGLILSIVGPSNFTESLYNLEKSFNLKKDLFFVNEEVNNGLYLTFIQHFYYLKDKPNFILVSNRLKQNNHPATDIINQILSHVERGVWPEVDFK